MNAPASDPPPAGAPRLRKKKSLLVRLALAAAALLTVLIVGLAAAGWYAGKLMREEPTWWAGADVSEVEDAPRRAQLLEQGVTTALHEPRTSDEPWSVRMSDDDVNAWLEHRLGSWLENRSMDVPPDFSAPRVRVEGGRVTVGFKSPDPRLPGVLAVEFTPELLDDGSLRAAERSYSMGNLPLPDPQTLGRLRGALARQARGTPLEDVIGVLLESGRTLPADVLLNDDRRVRLQRLSLRDDGSIDLTLATVRDR